MTTRVVEVLAQERTRVVICILRFFHDFDGDVIMCTMCEHTKDMNAFS